MPRPHSVRFGSRVTETSPKRIDRESLGENRTGTSQVSQVQVNVKGLDATTATVYFAMKSSVDGILKLHPLDQISQFSVASKENFSWFDIFKFRKHSVLSGTLSY